jgi:hypothetical protein
MPENSRELINSRPRCRWCGTHPVCLLTPAEEARCCDCAGLKCRPSQPYAVRLAIQSTGWRPEVVQSPPHA